MKSDVECAFGFRRTIVATGTPDLDEITAKVSPAPTIQKRFLGETFVVVADVVATTCFRAAGAVPEVVPWREPPASTPERISTTAIVAASRNAAGAT